MKRLPSLPFVLRWQVASALMLFALTGQALAQATISGTVMAPEGKTLEGARVVATDDKFNVIRADVDAEGKYQLEVAPGTYTVALIARGLQAPVAKSIVVAADKPATQDITAAEAAPFCIVKAPAPIPLDQDIDSAAFADAPEIRLSSGENLVIARDNAFGDWGTLGGPNLASGRFKIKYSEQALHLAADLTLKTPLVNNQPAGTLYEGNSLEFYFQNDPYDIERTAYEAEHNWQLVVGLGETPDWYLHGQVGAAPGEPIDAHILRKPKEDGTGEKLRLDIPFSIFLDGPDGTAITAPKDNDLVAMDIALNVADPEADRAEAKRRFQLSWSGFENMWTDPSQFRAAQFCPQPPATAGD